MEKFVKRQEGWIAACKLLDNTDRGSSLQGVLDGFREIDGIANAGGFRDELWAAVTHARFIKWHRGEIGFDSVELGWRGATFNKDVKPAYGDILDLPVWVEIETEFNEYGFPYSNGKRKKVRLRLRDAMAY